MKSILLIVIASLLLSSCHRNMSESAEAFDQVLTEQFSKEMKKTEGFQLVAFGGVRSPKIRKIDLDYNSKRKVNIQEARILLVQSVSKLLKKVNESEILRPHIDQFPYSVYGIHFNIFFKDDNMRRPTDSSIGWVCLFGFKNPNRTYVLYEVYDATKDDWIEVHEETWEEAERIVREGSAQCIR